LHFQGEQELEVLPWEQVEAVWPDWHDRKGCLVSYEEASGLRITKDLKEYALLSKHIQTQVTRVKLPTSIDDFEQGKACAFVCLQGWNLDEERPIVKEGFLVTQQGLKYKRQFLPWNEVASLEMKGKKVGIMPRNGSPAPRVSVLARQIANVEVLVGLVSHVLTRRNES
jgi:hypothetical protein